MAARGSRQRGGIDTRQGSVVDRRGEKGGERGDDARSCGGDHLLRAEKIAQQRCVAIRVDEEEEETEEGSFDCLLEGHGQTLRIGILNCGLGPCVKATLAAAQRKGRADEEKRNW
ncbi:hypothetical protein ERJ75_001120900 [Trypanosoma vivax]|nr:hypothetical protein ERJ75_001120900 [Trypanosoma vivax]